MSFGHGTLYSKKSVTPMRLQSVLGSGVNLYPGWITTLDGRWIWSINFLRQQFSLKIIMFTPAARYKIVRNEITSELRNAKSRFFKEKLASVKRSAAAHWNLIAEATNPVRRSKIDPLKREDGSLDVNDKDKANLMNEFFANIGIKLDSRIDNFSQQIDHTGFPAPLVS